MTDNQSFQETDFPGLYQAANADSLKAQHAYFNTLGFFLILLILGAITSLFSKLSSILNLGTAFFLLCSLLLSGLLAWKRFDRTWYSARAVAESVKTRTWRYMMRCEPYEVSNDNQADEYFLTDLNDILSNNREVTKELCDESASKDAISSRMKQVRDLPVEERLSFYLINRVSEQGKWYHCKARINKKKGNHWFFAVVGLNTIAILCALLQILFSGWTYLPTEVLTVAAASAVSWLQSKRFSDLSTSYALTSHEINIIRARGSMINSNIDLSLYVRDTENAFSREHTQWAARRDAVCGINKREHETFKI